MKYSWPFILILLLCGIHVPRCYADTTSGAIKDTEFVIEKQKKNKVSQEKKIFFKAPTKSINKTDKPVQEIQDLTLEKLPFYPTTQVQILSESTQEDIIESTWHNYCKLGVSSLPLPYVDIFIEKIHFARGIWSANVAFFPELFGIKARQSWFSVDGKYAMASWLLHTHLHYQNDWHKYARRDNAPEQNLHQGSLCLHAKKSSDVSAQEGKITYHPLAFHHGNITEQLFTLKYKWIKPLDAFTFKISTYNDIAFYKNDTVKKKRFVFSGAPMVVVALPKDIQLKAGLWATWHNDPISGNISNFDVCPKVKISTTISEGFNPYLGIEGMGSTIRPRHLRSVVQKNPFIDKDCKLSHSYQCLKLQGGSKGSIADDLSYCLDIAYRGIKNLSRMVATPNLHRYTLFYSPITHYSVKTTGLFHYIRPTAKMSTTIKATYYHYMNNNTAPIWWYNKPSFKLNPTLLFKVHPKVLLKSGLHLRNGTAIKDSVGNITNIGTTIDISLEGEYAFSERFLAFLSISNLLNRDNPSYTGYAGKKINITAGIQYKW
ncbi:hypothetical protein [Cardinium endosymbiont of Culicoides punctatus]|uniref:hypothetical protein n=1 Tax=Cardinium endosymbiont of Culicoides punctatus TaxID=2304601 RepID=UPI001058C3AF|nr:hypothetical protein [Cardinium endosymbiont of Culicoides punctatus]